MLKTAKEIQSRIDMFEMLKEASEKKFYALPNSSREGVHANSLIDVITSYKAEISALTWVLNKD